MAGYSSNPGKMDNPYSDGAMSAPMDKAPEEGEQSQGQEGVTGILPKAILMGKDFKVGEEVVLKITAIHGDEIQVEYASEEGGNEGEGYGGEPAMGKSDTSAEYSTMSE